MSAPKQSVHAKLLEFFDYAPENEVELMFGLIRDKVRNRREHKQPVITRKALPPAGRKSLSPAARKKISEAQKRRWGKKDSEKKVSPQQAKVNVEDGVEVA